MHIYFLSCHFGAYFRNFGANLRFDKVADKKVNSESKSALSKAIAGRKSPVIACNSDPHWPINI
jgi:hypothetical protein